MNRYAALLRGINISGKNKIPMADLKKGFEEIGYTQVKTYLNSGNILFDSDEDTDEMQKKIETMIRERYALEIPVFIIAQSELRNLLAQAPDWWGTEDKKTYDNLIFVMHGHTAAEMAEKIGEPSADLEQISIVDNAVFWTFDLAKHAKANWWKRTAMNGIAEDLTIRTAGTCRKIAG